MVPITSLWIAILLSAVIVFIASFITHIVLSYHRNEYRKFPDEDGLSEAIRKANVSPGFYAFPYSASPKEMKSPEIVEKFKKGPVALLTMFPNGPAPMGKYLTWWFLYCVLIGVFVAYLTGRTTGPGAAYLSVFRLAATIAFLGYGVGHILNSIWMGQPWSATIKHMFDGLLYGLLTGGVFGWLWPR
ncbi:hypothetical protein L0244_31540 [bacterium]|nr:hypothetical protein [bacterium]